MRCPRCDHALPDGDRFCGRCGLSRNVDGKAVDPLLGIVVDGRYRIEERIGVGGMGTVYRGTHVELGQKVAVKVLHQRHVANPDLVERFRIEARTYARVDHPNVVKLLHADTLADGTTYMVMEYCPGTSLAQHLRAEGRMTPRLTGDVAMQIAQGLGATHAAGIVHRDLKPENIVLTQTRRGRYHVKLLDFGIAKDLEDEGPRLTQHGMVFGTPEYMAPEQARGQPVDERSDLYALGCVMYEMLCGRPPFTGADKLRVMHQQASDPPQPLSERLGVGEVPDALVRIIDRCLSKRIHDRFANAEALIADLEVYLDGDHSAEAPPSAAERDLARATASPTTVGTPVPARVDRLTPDRPARGSLSRELRTTPSRPLPGRPTPDGLDTRTSRRTPVGAVALDLDPPDDHHHGPLAGNTTSAGGLSTLLGDESRPPRRDSGGAPFAVVILIFLGLAGGAVFMFGREAPPKNAGTATVHLTTQNPADAAVGVGTGMPPDPQPPRRRRGDAGVDAGTAVAATDPARSAASKPVQAPATEPPNAPATQAPKAPATEPPKAPTTKAPKAPATEPPKAPATRAPRAPATQAPKAPATRAPRAPATQPAKAPAGPTPEARVADARKRLAGGDLAGALSVTEAALADEPDHEGAQAMRRELLSIQRDMAMARQSFDDGDCKGAMDALQTARQKAPRLAEVQRIMKGCEVGLPPKEM